MRISKAGLLVLVAFVFPVVVELRTVLAWLGVEMSVTESLLLGVAAIVAVVAWAMQTPDGETTATGQ